MNKNLSKYIQGLPSAGDTKRLSEVFAKDMCIFKPGEEIRKQVLFSSENKKGSPYQNASFDISSLNDNFVIECIRLTHNLQFKLPATITTQQSLLKDDSAVTTITAIGAGVNDAGLSKSLEFQMQKIFEEYSVIRVYIEDSKLCDIPFTACGTEFLAPTGTRMTAIGSTRSGYYELQAPIAIPTGGKITLEFIPPEGFIAADLNKTTPYYPSLYTAGQSVSNTDPNKERVYGVMVELVCMNAKTLKDRKSVV